MEIDKRLAYANRVAEFREQGTTPPLETTKDGIKGDREWATEMDVSR
jgi:hypothetical protein